MTFRSRIFTTAMLLCHLLLLPKVVASEARGEAVASRQAPGGSQTGQPSPQAPSTGDGQQSTGKPHLAGLTEPGEEVTIQALQQEKAGGVYHLHGEVEIRFRRFVLRADDVTYNVTSGDITASG